MPTTEKSWSYPAVKAPTMVNQSRAYIDALPISDADKDTLKNALAIIRHEVVQHVLLNKDTSYTITIEQTSGGFVSGHDVVFVKRWYRGETNKTIQDNMQFPTEIAQQIMNKVNPSPLVRILTKVGDGVVLERSLVVTHPPVVTHVP